MLVETNQGNELELETRHIDADNGGEYDVVLPPDGWVGINDIAEVTDYQPQYVRKLVLDDKIEAVKIQRKGYEKWFVNPASAEEYRKSSHTRGGKRRFIFKIDLDDEDAVRAALDAADVDYDLELQYQPKSGDDDSATESDVEPEAGGETLDFLSE